MKNNGQYIKTEPTGVNNPEYAHVKVMLEDKQLKVVNEKGNMITVAIYNLQGIKIVENSGNESYSISLPTSGCYIVTVNDSSESYTMRKKIVVQ
jgi:hypothetical protein